MEILEKKTLSYQQLRNSGKIVYSVRSYHLTWINHEDIWVNDKFTFVLSDIKRSDGSGKINLTEEDFDLLEEYNRRMLRHQIPIEIIKSGGLRVEHTTKVDNKTLENLFNQGFSFSREYEPPKSYLN